jgi:hypothetical protein
MPVDRSLNTALHQALKALDVGEFFTDLVMTATQVAPEELAQLYSTIRS